MLVSTSCDHQLTEANCHNCSLKYERCPDGKMRRTHLPATAKDRRSNENAFFSFVRRLVGMELTRAGFPISFFEPIDWLMKQTEQMMYVNRLRKANDIDPPVDRMASVIGVCVSTLHTLVNSDRIMAANPIIGETYELCRPDYGFRIVLEQISHHPPIYAFHLESVDINGEPDNIYRGYGTASAKAAFSGTSVEARPLGFYSFELPERGECYTLVPPAKVIVSNLLRGMNRFKHRFEGEMEVTRTLTRKDVIENDDHLKAIISFHPPTQGTTWLGDWDETSDPPWADGHIENYKGENLLCFYGKYSCEIYSVPTAVWENVGGWKKALAATRKSHESASAKRHSSRHRNNHHSADHSILACTTPQGTSLFDFGLPKQKLLWRKDPLPAIAKEYFGMTKFAMQMNEPENDIELPPTDTRNRRDLRILETGDLDEAGKEKFRIEEKQRHEYRQRLAAHGKKSGDLDPWVPRWFRHGSHPWVESIGNCWLFTGDYYKRDWSECPDLGFISSANNNPEK